MNPLHDLHRQAEAEFQPYADIEIVSTFGEPQVEYAAIRKACGMMDLPQRGVLELTGKDRLTFLNNLLTNQTFDKQTKTGISAGQGVYAFLLDAKSGRIVTDVNAIERGERTLLEMDQRTLEPVRAILDRYLFAEQVKIATPAIHEIALHGPGSTRILADAAGSEIRELTSIGSTSLQLFGVDVILWRDDPTGGPGLILLMPPEGARTIWMNLLTRFGTPDSIGKRALRAVGWAAFNSTRIEAGRALFGVDFDSSMLPAETSELSRAVSFTKGCYPGQEIVARMHARGQVARRIAGIRMEGDALPIAGTKILDAAGNEIGGITSSTISPVLSNAAICLGLLKKPHFKTGTKLQIPAEGALREAAVVDLPFLPATKT